MKVGIENVQSWEQFDDDESRFRSRRKTLQGLCAAMVATILSPLAYAQEKRFPGQMLVYVSWGGVYQDAQKAAYCAPFAIQSGARVIQDGPMSEAKVRTMVAAGNPEWNVCDVTDTFLFNGAAHGLFEKIDYSIVQKSKVPAIYATEYGIGNCVWSYNVCYSTHAFANGKGPKTWADLFDTKRFPGKRMFRNRVYGTLEIALLADGVAPEKLYPLDVERALRKLQSIRDDITWWNTPSQAQQLIVDGAVTCGVIQNGRAYDAVKKGAPLAIEWAQNLQSVDYLVVLKGSRNIEAAMHLLNRSIQEDAQAKFVAATGYAPVNLNALTHIDASMQPWLPTQKQNAERGVLINGRWWQDKLDALSTRWDKWRVA